MTDSTNNPNDQPAKKDKPRRDQANNPLHGITLKEIVMQLERHYGWEELGQRIPINCFKSNPSLKSCLTFLRKTPWARAKVEQLYIQSKQRWGKYKKNSN